MRYIFHFLISTFLLVWTPSLSAQIIAQQDFNSLTAGTFTTDQLPNGVQLTNAGSRNIGGPGLDFASTWFDTRGETLGPVTPSGDASDFIGVNAFSGSSAPDVAADGTPVAAGSEQNFEFNDTDGAVVLNFESVDLSGFTNRQLTLNYWIHDTGYESDDAFTVSISNGGLGIVLLGFGETELEANAENGEASPASWKTLTVDLDAVLAGSGLNPANIILSVAVDVNSSSENIFVDDVVFESIPVAPCNITSLTANFLPCWDNNTGAPEDDTFIADFTTKFTNPPTTGDIELVVGGQTYSTSVAGLGTQFQFLSIPLPANGQPVVATIRFTAVPSCFLTATVGTAPQPCSVIDPCTELFISEYIEGSGFNKCVEIYNPTGTAISLSDYDVFLSFNGGTFENDIPLTGVIAPGDVYVICNSAAASDFLAQADQVTGDLNFNGNDAILLRNSIGTIDAIGQQGNSTTYGTNVTLRRQYTVNAGDNNPFDAFNLSEWDSYPSNTFWGLGYHLTACQPGLPLGWNPFVIGCKEGTVSESAGQWTLMSSCFNPAFGQDDLTYAFQPFCGDGEIIARVQSVDPYGRAGVMFRETMTAGSRYAWLNAPGGFWGNFTFRATPNAAPVVQQFPNFGLQWLRLTRQGNYFRAYVSFNGINWTLRGQALVPMEKCLFVGLALHSNVDKKPVTAVFDNVQINSGVMTAFDDPVDLLPAPADPDRLILQPNPARHYLDVTSGNWTDEVTLINIFDTNGRRLYSDRFDRHGPTLHLDLDAMGLPAGTYFLHIVNGEKVRSERFIKQ